MALDARQRLIEANAWEQENQAPVINARRKWGPLSLTALLRGEGRSPVEVCNNARAMLDSGTAYLRTIIEAPTVT
jgi:hypothetical protein